MIMIYHDESRPRKYEEVYEACQLGYGIKKPDLVTGFAGFFYRLPDVYAYGILEKWIQYSPKLEGELKGFIKRFIKEDYGFVTRSEYENNGENKWLGGSCRGSIARYSFEKEDLNHYGGIVLEFSKDYGLMYSIEEDMSTMYDEQYCDPDREQKIQYVSYQELMQRWNDRH